MNKEVESNFDDILYDQDIGMEIRIEIPEINYEEAIEMPKLEIPDTEEKMELKKEILYEKAINIDEVKIKEIEIEKQEEKTEEKKFKSIDNVEVLTIDNKKDKELKAIEHANILKKSEKSNIKETKKVEDKAAKIVTEKNKKLKKDKNNKEKKSKVKTIKQKGNKKETKIDNSYTENSTYLIILAIVILISSIVLLLNGQKREKNSNVVELVGDQTIILNINDEYKEPGYVAIDFSKGDVTKQVDVANNINTSVAGIYNVTYRYKDSMVKRNVIVQNKNEIKFELKGEKLVFSKLNTDFVEDGYEVLYNNLDYSSNVKKFGNVDLNKPGLYKLYYVINIDGNVKTLVRNVIVYTGEILDNNSSLVKDINNYLIDEIHYSNAISVNNLNYQVLLYFGVLNCQELNVEGLNICLNNLFKTDVSLKENIKYEGQNANIIYDKTKQEYVVKRLDLPRNTENIYKVILEGDNIYLYEKYAYKVLINNKEICDGKTKAILYSSVDRSLETGYEICEKSCETCEVVRTKNYIETLYKHTFKKFNNKYIWNKTEMVK